MEDEVLVSIIMPVYNVENYLKESIESILNQTYKNFEFFIFNDGSSDRSADIIKSYKDSRIKFLNYSQNCGYVKHLNDGLEWAKGKYIARMDSDDRCHPSRIEEQVRFMERNPDIGLCGTWYDITGGARRRVLKPYEDDVDIRIELLERNNLLHPSIMMRSSIIKDLNLRYDPNMMPAEDYFMWVQFSRVTKIGNVKRILLHYRLHTGQISYTKRKLQLEKVQNIRDYQIEFLYKRKLSNQEKTYNSLLYSRNELPLNQIEVLFIWIDLILVTNLTHKVYDQQKLESFLDLKISSLILFRNSFSISVLKFAIKHKLLNNKSFSIKIKFILKCIFNYTKDYNLT